MTTQEVVANEFKSLIKEGHSLATRRSDNDYFRFRTRALNLIRRVCGDGSEHHRELRHLAENLQTSTNPKYFPHCLGVLEAAQRDFEAGLLFDLRSLITAELLGDFLDQAETLFAKGYYHPAASLTGAVLEDTLRKLCQAHEIAVPERTTIEPLNVALAKAQVYNALTQKRITALADIRNNAGQWAPRGWK